MRALFSDQVPSRRRFLQMSSTAKAAGLTLAVPGMALRRAKHPKLSHRRLGFRPSFDATTRLSAATHHFPKYSPPATAFVLRTNCRIGL
jgi:hypothetical protein